MKLLSAVIAIFATATGLQSTKNRQNQVTDDRDHDSQSRSFLGSRSKRDLIGHNRQTNNLFLDKANRYLDNLDITGIIKSLRTVRRRSETSGDSWTNFKASLWKIYSLLSNVLQKRKWKQLAFCTFNQRKMPFWNGFEFLSSNVFVTFSAEASLSGIHGHRRPCSVFRV